MTCPRVAVFSSSSVGTVNRFLPIVSELVLRKCEVRYYIADPAFERVIQHTGAAAELFDDFLGCWPDLLAEDADWFQRGKLPSVVQEHHDLERYFYALPAGVCLARRLLKLWEAPGAWVPSLVIYSVADLHPCLVSAKLGIPCVAVVSCFLLDRYPACLPDEQQSSWPAVIAEHEGVQAANMIAQDEFGTNCLKEFLPCRYFSRCLNIIVSIPDVESEDLEKPWMKELSFVWVGFTGNQTYHINGVFVRDANKLHRLPSDVSAVDCPWRMPLPGGVKILVVSLGSEIVGEGWNILHKCDSKPFTGRDFSRRVWRELVESFRGRNDVRVVMAIGPQPDAAEGLGKIPGNFIARRSIAQMDALSRASAFITHGGGNSVMEGLLAGVPMVLIPCSSVQQKMGQLIERTGAGIVLWKPMEAPAGAIAKAGQAAMFGESGASQRLRAQELGAKLLAAGGSPAAAEACLEQLQHRWS
ncbi:yojK [Symbiodinium natans]|uniref:YojK protein n=1 Tax=Symbiodinium natans TaxID=878477 RepID=A0A812R450_9DINO|nr:yojK [Symbiodinium natans]